MWDESDRNCMPQCVVTNCPNSLVCKKSMEDNVT